MTIYMPTTPMSNSPHWSTNAAGIGDDGALTLDPAGLVIAEDLACRVLANGGRVLALSADRLPGGSPVTAVLRYAQ